ncbi:MAG TPA: tetratricopeptide repeat protein [Pyrinomonadaceae bacterium]|nr:tetratricopeptide repeat protein [Pyrinomonadaceae bacterium]
MWIPSIILGLLVLFQAPPAIQIFMPGGTLPPRPIRLTLTRDDGRIEVVFTDTKGKFQVTGDLIRDADYIVTVESDGATYDTTVARFRILRNTPVYTTVFLRPFTARSKTTSGVVDARAMDVKKEAVTAYYTGMTALADGQIEAAITQLKLAVKISPHYLRALNDLGVLYLQLNQLPEAAELFAQAVKIDENFYLARLNLGVVKHRQGHAKEAVQILGLLYQKDRSMKGLALSYADALLAVADLTKAEQVLRGVLSEPTIDTASQVDLHFKLGVILNRQDRFDEAAVELRKAVTINDTAANAHLLLGATLLQLNRLEEAEKSLLRSYELAGAGAGTAQMFLGQLYLMQQKPPAALKAFEQYLKDVPTAANAVQIKAEVEKLKAATKN